MKFNYLDVPVDVIEKVKKSVSDSGYTYHGVMRKSNHPSDHYLYLVVGQGGCNDDYCVWLFNSSVNKGDGSLGDDYYDLSLPRLFEVLGERLLYIRNL